MALEAAVFQQDLFGLNNGNNNNNNKDLFPLLFEPWSSDHSNTIINNNNDSFFPYLKFQDPQQNNNSYDLCNTSTTSSNSCYLLESNNNNNQVEFDWHSYYYYHHGIDEHDVFSTSDLPPLNAYDGHECIGLVNSSSPEVERKTTIEYNDGTTTCAPMEVVMRPKQRRRARVKKNQEEIENQRMTHIAVERNRRKQMNEYLNVLRSLMPESYVQRGDQASIVGAAINFVKELEHNVQSLSAKKQMKENNNLETGSSSSSSMPFEEFLTFPQFSSNGDYNEDITKTRGGEMSHPLHDHASGGGGGLAADVEVTMVESHAHLKIRLRRPPKQLSKLVSGLHTLRLSILHLNVNTAHNGVVLYSFSLKVEDESKLSSVDEIAREVYLLLGRIQQETS